MNIGSVQPSATAPTVARSRNQVEAPMSAPSHSQMNAAATAERNCVPSSRSGVVVYIPAEMRRER